MGLIIENISSKIIGIGAVSVLPGERKEVPVNFEGNPILDIYVNVGHARITGTPTVTEPEVKVENEDAINEDAINAAEELRKARLASLVGISDEDLGKLANELGINPADCKDQADVFKKVKAALKK